MARKIKRDYSSPHAYDYITPKEWRLVLDRYLSGAKMSLIAKEIGRNTKSVALVLNKTRRNYDEEGDRESPLSKLERAVSSLDPKRTPTGREIEYIKKLIGYGRTLAECSFICNIPASRLQTVRDGFFLLFPDQEDTNAKSTKRRHATNRRRC